ncbi:sigma-70 family RNA polymerase sigma factor [Streptomyces sp. AN091965]|uniref:sigma-70 family RNA polymerase sigma factor n=1 Tax=Streptomyces sp. AN091965 TaxID=2927803 RepID=UPI001F5FFC94|nr:sigma-70 family RNA polymerase sigma factor [Streptomyces sp. AN091965]MCI3935386.1 sigma-70 family RNA polymerase sigma factor [Streptomyces sp. AN091965]
MQHDQWEPQQGDGTGLTALVVAGRAGDARAQDELVAAFLPLVYNIVGRALSGHADVDDLVQDVMVRMLRGLPGLRDPDSFRSWLVAIAMNETRRHQRPAPVDSGLQDAYDVPDPGGDFTDVTILRLGLSGERKEVARATRWMDDDHRELLALWWLEAAGELSRGEVAAALELTPEHTAVRVQRMKAQLETARVVVRALAAEPRCPVLAQVASGWDGRPSALWRKRLVRHTRDCASCGGLGARLTPAEGLLAGIALVPPLLVMGAGHFSGAGAGAGTDTMASVAYAGDGEGHAQAMHQHEAGASGDVGGGGAPDVTPLSSTGTPGSRARLRQGRRSVRRRRQAVGAGAGVAAIAALAGVMQLADDSPEPSDKGSAVALESAEPSVSPTVTQEPSRSPSPSASPSKAKKAKKPSPTASPSRASRKKTAEPPRPTPSTKAAPRPTTRKPAPPAPSGSKAQQVLSLVNAERAKAGCGPLTHNSKLATAAQRHSADMRSRNYFDHTSPDGTDPGQRITAAGYKWSTYGENIARGQQTAASVMDSWMNSEGHRANILNCSFKELGTGVEEGEGGPWWTQNFGARG